MRRAIYPGTFDPVTYGHLDVLERATRLFDEVIVAVAPNTPKGPLFSLDERMALLRENVAHLPMVRVQPLEGLTVDFAHRMGAVAVVRGLRAISDFEYEFQLAQMNRHLDSSIETVFLMPNQQFFYTSSNIVKEVCRLARDRVASFVPPNVQEALATRYNELGRAK